MVELKLKSAIFQKKAAECKRIAREIMEKDPSANIYIKPDHE